jgi:hypothetical protein
MKTLISAAVSLILCASASGQHNLGISTSNWSCMNSMYLNPANIAESREKKAVNLASFAFGVDNNVGPFNAGQGLVVAVGDGKTNNMFNYANNSKVSMHAPFVDVTGPGMLIKVDEKHSVAFSTRVRGINQFNNFDQTLFHTFNDPKFRTTDEILASPKNFTYTVHMWSEIGFTYGGVFYDKGAHKIKAGGTVRYLGGIAYVGVKGRNMDVKFSAGNDTFYAANTDIEYASNILNTKSSAGSNISQSFFSLLYKGKFGHGLGGDFGLVYEYNPDDNKTEDAGQTENKRRSSKTKQGYRVRFSMSVVDIGVIHYSKEKNANELFTGNGYVTGVGILNNVKNFDNIRKYAVQRGFNAEIRQMASKVYMPTRLMFGGDYHIQKHYYTNVTFLVNLADRKNFGNSYYNQFTVTPRYETKKVSVGLPVTFSTLSNRFKVGLGFLAGGFFIGSDDMLALAVKGEYGISFYTGLNVPIYK